MASHRLTLAAAMVAAMINLSACGSGSDSDTTDMTGPVDTTDPADGSNTTDPADGSNNVTFGPPQYTIGECGTVAIADTATSTSVDTPATLQVGEVVSGQLVPSDDGSKNHIWSVSLEPGNYHLVADAWNAAKTEKSAVGLEVTSLGATTGDNERLLSDSDFAYELRDAVYLEIREARTMTLEISTLFSDIVNYNLGVFANGSAVPSPTFSRCLPVNTLSLESTQSVVLNSNLAREDFAWFALELDEGVYSLSASTQASEQTTLGYTFDLLERFGQTGAQSRITSDSEYGSSLSTNDNFQIFEAGTVWIRADNLFSDPITVEFTLSQQ